MTGIAWGFMIVAFAIILVTACLALKTIVNHQQKTNLEFLKLNQKQFLN